MAAPRDPAYACSGAQDLSAAALACAGQAVAIGLPGARASIGPADSDARPGIVRHGVRAGSRIGAITVQCAAGNLLETPTA